MRGSVKGLVIAGLALGAVLGMAGTFVTADNVRAVLWAIDGTALVVATVLLALAYFRKGNELVAAGFLVYAIGEAVMLGGTAGSLVASVPAFAAGTALWSAGLLLTCAAKEFALWARAAGCVAAVLFAIVSVRTFWGEGLTPIARPLPYFAYPFLVATFVGWGWRVAERVGSCFPRQALRGRRRKSNPEGTRRRRARPAWRRRLVASENGDVTSRFARLHAPVTRVEARSRWLAGSARVFGVEELGYGVLEWR